MDKIKFAKLVSWISRIANGIEFAEDDLRELDQLVTPVEAEKLYVSPQMVAELLAAMGQPGKKIEAIKAYRALTGEGLKESKDVVEKYWNAVPTINNNS